MTTQTETLKLIDSLMEQAQVFASAWSLVGGRFDDGGAMDDAEVAKAELRRMIEEALAGAEGERQQSNEQVEPTEVRLWDSQWINVVNHDNCYQGWNKEDAINHAVKMTEKYIASNFAKNTHPPVPTAQPEYDYKDLYEKEKRRSAMWLAKYEEIAGPVPKAYPVAQPEQNLSCKSTQARLAASWGYVKAKPLTYVDLRRIANQCGLGANEVSARTQATVDNYARAIEAAHGIGCETTLVKK